MPWCCVCGHHAYLVKEMVSEWFSSVFLLPSFLVLVACGDCLAQSGQLYIYYALQGGFISNLH